MKIKLPTDVRMIIDRFEKNGFSAYAVGGCVRDSLLQKEPNDWDICTDALPQDILRLFSDFHTFDTGIKHGTVSVVINSSVYEITTFRIVLLLIIGQDRIKCRFPLTPMLLFRLLLQISLTALFTDRVATEFL